MNVSQLKTLISIIDNNFSVSKTAEQLCLVQSAVSQQLLRLEGELGSDLFVRKGKRLTGLTELGDKIEQHARASLMSINNISLIASDHQEQSQGVLRIGCTHTQARYILPPIIKRFNKYYPHIELQMHQGNPKQLAEWASTDQVDFSICTEELGQSTDLKCIAGYQWNRCLVTRPDHPLLTTRRLTLKQLCNYPIITYVAGFTGRKNLDATFTKQDLTPNIVLSAADTDIIKAYVLDDLGIGIIASMAYNANKDKSLKQRDLSHLFPWETTRIAYPKNKYIRKFQQTFIDLFLQVIQQEKSSRFKAL
jgi:LysR family cys regulon transcriptional activator